MTLSQLHTLILVFLLGPMAGCQGTTAQVATTSNSSPVMDEKQQPGMVKIGGIDWYVDYDAAMKVAQERNKPVWLHFGENPG